jgi:hypothetical protein
VLEHVHDLRHHVAEQAGDDEQRHYGDDRRVQQREPGALPHRLAPLKVLGEPGHHGGELARLLAGRGLDVKDP